jgi:hypothetical protein
MSLSAPLSKYRKHNWIITICVLLGAAVIFGYDGYLSKYEWSMRHSFYQKHVLDNGGVADGDMTFNQKGAPILAAAGIAAAIYYLFFLRTKVIVADDQGLRYEKLAIPYDHIESIDKTHFDSKGFFIVHYSDSGQKKELKLSDRGYDNLPAVLDHLVSKIVD